MVDIAIVEAMVEAILAKIATIPTMATTNMKKEAKKIQIQKSFFLH